jgi:hypothetical protein
MEHEPTMRRTLAAGVIAAVAASGCSGPAPDGSSPTGTTATTSALSFPGQGDGRGQAESLLARLPATPTLSASTVPANGDVNPYGVAFVPPGFPHTGILRPGDVVVANFNDASNLQGTGTTIVRVNANASPSLFFEDDAAPGFSTALGVLARGFVLVGNVPSSDGSGACTGAQSNVGQGALLVIDAGGRRVATLADATFLDGPWDMTVEDDLFAPRLFVSNVLSGTVTRVDLRLGDGDGDRDDRSPVVVTGETQIASGYQHRCDPGAFVVGPTGLALDRERDVLYVASAGDNAIYAIDGASDTRHDRGTGRMVVSDAAHLHGPLGLVVARNGDLISAQGDAVNPDPAQPSEIAEFAADGRFVDEFSIDSSPGSAFGMALVERGDGFRFAAVDDGQNVLDVWEVR